MKRGLLGPATSMTSQGNRDEFDMKNTNPPNGELRYGLNFVSGDVAQMTLAFIFGQ